MTTAFDAKNPARFEVPVPPQEFGQDGGKFYHYYDALADEIDDNMVTGLKEQLDGLLIFAGLFAGVNSAFLALTLPLMSPDPADDTNALLRDILVNLASGRNDSLPSTNALPSETFFPSGKILTVNVLFAVSLTFALVSSFMAVLGRQWLIYYRKRTGGGPERQRWEQLKRFLGAERWQLEMVLDDVLPSLLQIGLIIFCVSLTIYLNTLHPILSNVVGVFMCAGLAILIVTATFAIWDKFCPFQSPLSHFLRTAGVSFISLLRTILWPVGWIAVALHDCFVYGPGGVDWSWENNDVKIWLDEYLITPITSLFGHLNRKEEGDGVLQITAIRRAICTSDDALTQAHAVSNILGITNAALLRRLVTDEEFDGRISRLCTSSYNRTLQLCGRDRVDLAAATSWLYRAAIAHIFLSTVHPDQQLTDEQRRRFCSGTLDFPSLSLSRNLMQSASPNMTIAYLGFMAVFTDPDRIRTQTRRLSLRATIDGLVNPSWKSISMITEVMMVHWGIHGHYFERLDGRFHLRIHEAWVGKPSTVHRNLKSLLKKSNDPQCEDRDVLRESVGQIVKLTGKAAADSGGDSSSRPAMAAGFLRFLETTLRGKHSSSNLINVGRNLRVELISILQSECEKLSRQIDYALEDMLEELCKLFEELKASVKLRLGRNSLSEQTVQVLHHRSPDLVTVDGRSLTTSNEEEHELLVDGRSLTTSNEDDELLYSFSPLLRKLTLLANTLDVWGGFKAYNDDRKFKSQVSELNATFASFKAAVKSGSREKESRNRDPDIRWCYYNE